MEKRNAGATPEHPMMPVTDLWLTHRPRLRNYVAKRVRERDAVDDILQEVFLKASAGLHRVRCGGSIPAWLYRIAAHAIADHYRAQRPWEELPADDELAAPETQADLVAELAACVPPFIAELPEAYRTALLLSEMEGLPQKEVAHRLGISLSGAKSRVQRGREKLRQRMLDCCHIETGRNGITGYERRDGTCSVACG